jgi:hypothetical protein
LLATVARKALSIMHYDIPDGDFSSDSLKDAVPGDTKCVAGCYSCLLSYYNQPEHRLIDRRDADALEFLTALAHSAVSSGERGKPAKATRGEDSPLSEWLDLLRESSCNMPDELSKKIMNGQTAIDAFYKDARAAVFIGEVACDVRDYLEGRGFRVVLFPEDKLEWAGVLGKYREIFFARKTNDWGDDL